MPWPIDYDPRDFKKLKVPKVPAKTLQELGRFMMMWSILEDELHTLVTAIYRLDPTLALTITANLGTKAKIEMLRSSFDLMRDALGKDFVAEADSLFVEIADLATGSRNVLAHGTMVDGHSLGDPGPLIARFSSRKQLELRTYPIDAVLWREQSKYAKELAVAVRQMVPRVVHAVKNLSAEEIYEMCKS